jgi:hypothetical protein
MLGRCLNVQFCTVLLRNLCYGELMKIKKLLRWAAAVVAQIFVFSVLAFAQTPTLVYSDSLATPHESGNGFKVQYGGSMGTGTLSGNLLTLRMTYPHGATVSSIADTFSDVYILGVSTDSGSGGWVTALYYLAGAPAGVNQITVTFSAAVSDWNATLREYSGVATVSPTDGTCSNSASTVACSSAITTTLPGDLVVASTVYAGAGSTLGYNVLTAIAPGSGFNLDAADTYIDYADEEEVQTAAGSITPSFTMTGVSGTYSTVAMAFKAAGLGTNPTGMYILHQHHQELNNNVSSQVYYFPSAGNLLVASVDDGDENSDGNVVGIASCTPSNTWTHRSATGTDIPQILFVPSLSPSTSMSCTVSSGGIYHSTMLVIYDVVGAASSSKDIDSIAFHGSGATLTNAPDVTPTTQPGIAFAVSNTGVGPTTGVSTGFIFDNTPYTGESDSGQMNNGDGWQHFFYTSTSQIAFTWTQTNAAQWLQAFAITFKSGAPPPTVVVTISPESDTIDANATLQFTSTVTGSTNTSITWTATCGTVNSTGLYTAPAIGDTCTVTATSQANPADFASASITVTAPPPPPTVVVTVSPTSDSINAGTTLQFTSTVTGSANTAVTWSASCGTINSNGLYTAPATASFCTVTATSLANAADSAFSSVTVTAGPPPPPPTIVITISPTSISINVNARLQFTASVKGSTNTSVAWTRTCGRINSSGLYTAPATASFCTVTATSLANAADSASASVTVTAIRRHH